jgi:hypothetical protein
MDHASTAQNVSKASRVPPRLVMGMGTKGRIMISNGKTPIPSPPLEVCMCKQVETTFYPTVPGPPFSATGQPGTPCI